MNVFLKRGGGFWFLGSRIGYFEFNRVVFDNFCTVESNRK